VFPASLWLLGGHLSVGLHVLSALTHLRPLSVHVPVSAVYKDTSHIGLELTFLTSS
jgi:hypothetical protein